MRYSLVVLTALCLQTVGQINPQPVNLGFESMSAGNYTTISGWNTVLGTISTVSASALCQTAAQASSMPQFKIANTPFTVPQSNPEYFEFDMPVLPSSPLTGSKALEINSSSYLHNFSVGMLRAEQSFSVTAANQILQYAYFMAMRNSFHPCCESHYGRVQLFDCSGNIIPGTESTLVPYSTSTMSACFSSNTVGLSLGTGNTSPLVNTLYSPNWLIKTYNLAPYIGPCVKLRAEAGACSASGHSGTFYFDAGAHPSVFPVNNAAVSGSTYYLCNSGTATLSAIPGWTYAWTGPANFSSTMAAITTTVAGVYTLTIGNPGTAALTQTLNLVMATTPTLQVSASTTTLCTGQSAILTATGTGISTYSWSNGGTASAITVTPSANTVYTVTANASTCPASATVGLNVSACVGISEYFSARNFFNVFPNPSTDHFVIKAETGQNIKITDVSGRLILEDRLDEHNNYRLTVTGLSQGVYFITNTTKVLKLIISQP